MEERVLFGCYGDDGDLPNLAETWPWSACLSNWAAPGAWGFLSVVVGVLGAGGSG
jgi:hypothetical protein